MRTIKIDTDSIIEDIVSRNTGGNIYVEYITLKSGIVIAIGDNGLTVYKNMQDEEDNIEIGHVEFWN